MEGRLDKIKKQYALLEQPALRDNNKTVGELIKETIAATGENIQVSHTGLSSTTGAHTVSCTWAGKISMFCSAACVDSVLTCGPLWARLGTAVDLSRAPANCIAQTAWLL